MRKRYLLTMVFIIVSSSLFSQSDFRAGFLIKNSGDTLYGLIDYRSDKYNSNKCRFKLNNKSSIEIYTPYDILEYRFDNDKYYISKEILIGIVWEKVFMEYLLNGTVDLYYLKSKNGDQYFIGNYEKGLLEVRNHVVEYTDENGNKEEKLTGRHKGLLIYFFDDCKELVPDIQIAEVNHKSLKGIAKKYHELTCEDGSTCIDYDKEVQFIEVGFNMHAGLSIDNLILESYYWDGFELEPMLGFVGGLSADIRWPRLNKNIAFQLGLELNKSSFDVSKFETGKNTWDTNINGYFDYLNLGTKLGLKYSYPAINMRPSIKIGISINKTLNYNSSIIEQNVINNQTSSIRNYDYFPLPESYLGFISGLGITIKLNNKVGFYTEGIVVYSTYRFNDYDGGYLDNDIKGKLTNINIVVGISF